MGVHHTGLRDVVTGHRRGRHGVSGISYDKFYAINPDGTQKWALDTGNVVYSSPIIGANGTRYVVCSDHHLCALNPDGTQQWAYPTADSIETSPVIGADGTVYFGAMGIVYAIGEAAKKPAGTP